MTSYDCAIFYFMDVFRLLSVWMVCFINIERCSRVFNPCHMPRLTSCTTSRLFVLILFIISLVTFGHYGQHMHIQYVYASNQTTRIRSICKFKSNFHRLTWECIKSGLTYWFTVPVCIVCNLIIIQRLHRASRIERRLNNNIRTSQLINTNRLDLSAKQRQLTVMLVTSSVFFVLTATPSTIHATYILITDKFNNSHYVIHICTTILLHFHHASNFLAFIFSCSHFRIELLNLFRRHFPCQFSIKCHKRSILHTSKNLIYLKKYQHAPINSVIIRSREAKLRNIQRQYSNGMILFEKNKYRKTNRHNLEFDEKKSIFVF